MPRNAETPSKYKRWLTKMFGFILNNVEEYMFDQNANHVMRTAVKCVTGENEQHADADKEFQEILDNFVDRLSKWSQLSGKQNTRGVSFLNSNPVNDETIT